MPLLAGGDIRQRDWKRSALGRSYPYLLFALGTLGVAAIFFQLGNLEWSRFSELLLLGGLATFVRVRLPGARESVSVNIFPIFAAVTMLPAASAFSIAAAAQALSRLVGPDQENRWLDLTTKMTGAAVAVVGSSAAFRFVLSQPGGEWWLAAGLAAGTYFGLEGATCAVLMALQQGVSPLKIWRESYFWSLPLYALAPVAAGAARLLFDSPGPTETIQGLAFLSGAGAIVWAYLGQLRDRETRAGRLAQLQQRTIEVLAVALAGRNDAAHRERVKLHAARLAKKLECSESDIQTLELVSVLHDVRPLDGKDYFWENTGQLSQREFNIVAHRNSVAPETLSSVHFPRPVEHILLCHHEHWDGTGHPRGLREHEIPLAARILAVVDSFDALVSDHTSRKALSIDQAVALMRLQRGKVFDPQILDAFLEDLPGSLAELQHALEQDGAWRGSPSKSVVEPPRRRPARISPRGEPLDLATLQELTSSPAQLVAFYEILRILGADLNFDKSLRECLRILRRAIPCDKAGIFLFEKDRYVLLRADGLPDHCVSRLTLAKDSRLVEPATRSGLPVVVETPTVPGHRGPRYLDDVASALVAPLIGEGHVIGIIALCSLRVGVLSGQQARFLGLITGKLAETVLSSQALRQIYLEAETDEMTNLPNTRAAYRRLDVELERARRDGTTVAVLFMDMNGLKAVNDSYGHGAGDKLLQETGSKLKQSLRSYDFLARIGGDEFLAVIPAMTPDRVDGKVEALKKAVEVGPVKVARGVYVRATMSVGAALFPEDATDAEELICLSDQRMYGDKQQSRAAAGPGSKP